MITMKLCKMGPSDNTWVTTIFPFPFKQAANGTLATQSSYTQEIHLKVFTIHSCTCVFNTNRVEWYITAKCKRFPKNMGFWRVGSETWTKENRQNYHQHCQAFRFFGWQFLLGDFGPKYTTNCCLPWTLSGTSLFWVAIFVELLGDHDPKDTKNCGLPRTLSGISLFWVAIFVELLGDHDPKYCGFPWTSSGISLFWVAIFV